MLRRSHPRLSLETTATSSIPLKLPWEWSRELVSFTRAPNFRACASFEELAAPHPDPAIVPAFVIPNIITEEQEAAILRYKRLLFNRLDFCDNHIDSLITHYKEFYRSSDELMKKPIPEIEECPQLKTAEKREITRMLRDALEWVGKVVVHEHAPASVPVSDRVHFLQLGADGIIKAHADNEANSSSFVAGLSFGSARVMTLTLPTEQEKKDLRLNPRLDPKREFVEMLLPPRSLYVLAGRARYDWFHSVDEAAVEEYPVPKAGKPIWFNGKPHEHYTRQMRSVMIWRGVSPRELFMHRHGKKQRQS